VPGKPPAPAVAEIRPFSPEWYARENEEQERLRRRLHLHLCATGRRRAREAGVAPDDLPAITKALLGWIDEDRKATPLKALQGMIWRDGFTSGELVAHIYPDAAVRLRQWHAAGHRIFVYSSGSIAAQQLYFAHTGAGDLTPLLDGHFDTTTGGKREADSYRAIADHIGVAPADILFLSDIEAELEAAELAGLRTVWLTRDGRPDGTMRPSVSSFDEIAF